MPTLLAVGAAEPERVGALRDLGCEVLSLEATDGLPRVAELLDELGRRRMTNVLVEGGDGVLGSFLDAGEVDEVHVFIAPRVIGGTAAKSPLAGAGVDKLADALRLTQWTVEELAGDVYLRGCRGCG